MLIRYVLPFFSQNPLIDIGQIEGAISMSLGYFASEQEKRDPESGVLLTNGTWVSQKICRKIVER